MKIFRTLSRILVGIVFIFSGFVKAVDPLGSTYKFSDYFSAFNMGFLEVLALPLAILLSSAELLIGISLLLSYRMRFFSWAVLIFMTFFTILTFILALTNPVTDCGCFGDALILTNWETFWKNVVLMVFTVIIFISREKFPAVRTPVIEWSILVVYLLAIVLFSLYNYRHLPLIDFRPYSVGTHIPGAMEIPEDAPRDEYETMLTYRNIETGQEKEFSIENFPRDTAKWEFVDSESVLVSKGFEPPIHDFIISNSSNEDITSLIIEDNDYNLLLVSHSLETAHAESLKEAENYFNLSLSKENIDFFAVTATSSDKARAISDSLDLDYSFALADEIMLKTTIRSNPGLILISEGVIIAKWAWRDFPGNQYLSSNQSLFTDFPFCKGCNLREINQVPPGYTGSSYNTVLYYRNVRTNELKSFSMEDFPANDDEWIFERTENTEIPGDYVSPLNALGTVSSSGIDFSEILTSGDPVSFLIFLKDPFGISTDSLNKINMLAAMAAEYLNEPAQFYGLTAMDEEEREQFTDENVSIFEFSQIPDEALNFLPAEEFMIVMVKNGIVKENWKDKIPAPEDLQNLTTNDVSIDSASEIFLSPVLTNYRLLMEERLIYVFIFGFMVSVFIIRTLAGRRKR